MLVDARMLAVFSIIALLVVPSFAATVQITGEEFAVVDIASGQFTFNGPVTVTDGATTIKGTQLVYQSKEEIVQFIGEVTIEQDGTSIQGKDLVYDASKGEGMLAEALASTVPAGAVSPVYVSGTQVTACRSLTVIDDASLTTCDPDQPGYFLASKRIEIRPGDRLVLHNVRFVESGMTLFYWPRVTFSLKRADPDTASEDVALPRIGYSAAEGWFVKSSFGYRGPAAQRGRLLIDYMQLLGWGFGIDHTLRADGAGSEGIYLYAQPNVNTGHTDLQLSLHGERVLPGDLEVSASSTISSEYDEGEELWRHHELSLAQRRSGGSSLLRYSDKRVTGAKVGHETYATLSHTQRSAGGWRFRVNANADVRDMPGLAHRNLVGYLADLGRETPNWGFDLTAEDRFNPELAKDVPSDITWSRAQRLPELRVRINRLYLAGRESPFAADLAWGNLTEDRLSLPAHVRTSTDRLHVALKVKPSQLSLGSWGRWRWGGSLTRRVYGTGERQWVAAAQSDYRLPISSKLALSADYRYEQGLGDLSPFRFDRVIDEETLTAALKYDAKNAGWLLSGGYDLLNEVPTDVVGSLRLQLSSALKMQVQAAYSVVDSDWIYTIGTVQYVPDEAFTLQLGSKYNMQSRRSERVDAVFRWDLQSWKVAYTGIYDGIKNVFDLGDFTITRDLGCRAIDLRYNQNRKEVWLEYRIPAFPAASVKVGATEKHLMFDAKGWEEVLATE
jgi:lipopolysaccharide export system protein LptA